MDGHGWGCLGMYLVADWETVYSIYHSYRGVDLPNLGLSKYLLMYCRVSKWIFIHVTCGNNFKVARMLAVGVPSH